MSLAIEHDPVAGEFYVAQSGARAYVRYERSADAIDITSTFVPEPLRKQGLAEAMVRATLAWAKDQGLKPSASCWYAEKFIR